MSSDVHNGMHAYTNTHKCDIKMKLLCLGMGAYDCHPSTWELRQDCYEFKANLDCMVCCRPI